MIPPSACRARSPAKDCRSRARPDRRHGGRAGGPRIRRPQGAPRARSRSFPPSRKWINTGASRLAPPCLC
jgi:hypothetical protein